MAHWVNLRKGERINAVNERAGLPRIRIHTPDEVLDDCHSRWPRGDKEQEMAPPDRLSERGCQR